MAVLLFLSRQKESARLRSCCLFGVPAAVHGEVSLLFNRNWRLFSPWLGLCVYPPLSPATPASLYTSLSLVGLFDVHLSLSLLFPRPLCAHHAQLCISLPFVLPGVCLLLAAALPTNQGVANRRGGGHARRSGPHQVLGADPLAAQD